MAKIINFDTFCYRRELKVVEKEAAARKASIDRLIRYARKHCNWEKKDDNPVDID